MPPVPKAVRIRTATGWQDIAIVGQQGPIGLTGPAGPPGDVLRVPVATIADLPITGLRDGELCLVLEDPRIIYSWVAAAANWEPVAGGGVITPSVLDVDPTSLTFTKSDGGVDPDSQILYIADTGLANILLVTPTSLSFEKSDGLSDPPSQTIDISDGS